jgi:hypothetical protein
LAVILKPRGRLFCFEIQKTIFDKLLTINCKFMLRFLSTIFFVFTSMMLFTSLQSCGKNDVSPNIITEQPKNPEQLHQEAETYAKSQGWSQGVNSLVAGVLDYYYYRNVTNGPILIKLTYQVNVQDFIIKIETHSKEKGYDPKNEGILQTTVSSLEGDNKNTTWFIPTKIIYDAKDNSKTLITFEIDDYPAGVQSGVDYNTIGKTEGILSTKQMQIYSTFGKRSSNITDRVVDKEKRGQLKDLL